MGIEVVRRPNEVPSVRFITSKALVEQLSHFTTWGNNNRELGQSKAAAASGREGGIVEINLMAMRCHAVKLGAHAILPQPRAAAAEGRPRVDSWLLARPGCIPAQESGQPWFGRVVDILQHTGPDGGVRVMLQVRYK